MGLCAAISKVSNSNRATKASLPKKEENNSIAKKFKLSFLAFAVLLLFILSSSSSPTVSFAATPSFSTPVNLGSALPGAAQNPNIAASGSCVYVSYPQTTKGHGVQMYVRSSSNNGVTFGAAVDVSQNMAGKHNFQRIWATGSMNAYITWEQTLSGGAQNILFSATTNCGASWSTPKQLNTVTIPSTCPYLCAQPTLTAVGSDVYVTWTQQNPFQTAMSPSCAPTKGPGNCEDVFVVASTNGGASFGPNHYFGNGKYVGGAHEPEIAASGSNVYITFDDQRLYFSESTNNGASWHSYTTVSTSENALVLNQQPTAATNREPHITASGSSVYVVWEANYATSTTTGKEKTFLQVSSNSGSTWLPVNSPITFGTSGGTWLPIVYAAGSHVYVAWGQIISGTFQAEISSSSNGGSSFGSQFNPGQAHDVQLATTGSLVYLMFFDPALPGGSGNHPAVVESTNGGTSFGSVVDLSLNHAGGTTEVQNDQPQIVISGSQVCATWLQSVGGTQEVLYSHASSP